MRSFYYGLAVGVLLGLLLLATVLDLLHLHRQHLVISLRDRWASLTLSMNTDQEHREARDLADRVRVLELENRDLRERVVRLDAGPG